MKKVIVFGNGQMAEIVHTYFIHDSDYDVVAFTVDKEVVGSGEFRNLPVVAFEDVHKNYPPDDHLMFILIGAKDCNRLRESKYLDAKKRGYDFASYISSKATICPENEIGENCFILENNVIQSFVKIKDNCVLWSGNHIGHHSIIHSHNYLASHVVVSGGVTINSYCYIGVNATIRDHIEIAQDSVIGAGALVMKPTVENGVYMGLPCKKTSIQSTDVDLP
jgi:sugar O-acyltransferase (sialic acid O-acetyltransferase NeuD family)